MADSTMPKENNYEFSTCYPLAQASLFLKCSEMAAQNSDSRGYLTIHSIQGKDLAVKDKMLGTSDPYVKIYNDQIADVSVLTSAPHIAKSTTHHIWKSSVIKKNLNPSWSNINARLGPLKKASNLKVDLWDYDTLSSDDYMGSCNFAVILIDLFQQETKSKQVNLTFTLASRSKERAVKGKLTITASWEDEEPNPSSARSSEPAKPDVPVVEEVADNEEEDETNYSSSPLGKLVSNLSIGFDASKGKRPTMEDAHVIIEDLRTTLSSTFEGLETWKGNPSKISFFAVYDGHGGKEVAEKSKEIFHEILVKSPEFAKGDVTAALKQAFLEADKVVIEEAGKSGWTSGAVAVIAVLIGQKLYVANLGDSEVLIGRSFTTKSQQPSSSKFRPIVVSHKHKPTDPLEKERIEKEGGMVFHGRVCGSLAISRALGDHLFKPPSVDGYFISNEPHIAEPIELRQQDTFLVLGCDGLFDRLSYNTIVDVVAKRKAAGASPTDICRALTTEAVKADNNDNITSILVFFNWSSSP